MRTDRDTSGPGPRPDTWTQDLAAWKDAAEIRRTAAGLEGRQQFRGSRSLAIAWLSMVGLIAGALGSAAFGSWVRASTPAAAFVAAATIALVVSLRPVTLRMLGHAMLWQAGFTAICAALLGAIASFAASLVSGMIAYGIAVVGGTAVGIAYAVLTMHNVRRPRLWIVAAATLAVAGQMAAVALDRLAFSGVGSIAGSLLCGAVAAVPLAGPMAILLFRLLDGVEALRQMAQLYLHNDGFAMQAVHCLDRALILRPQDADLFNLRGIAWSRMDRPDLAAADWSRAARLRPTDAEPHINLGVDYLRRNELDQAIAAFAQALAIRPGHALAHGNMAAALARKGDLDRAIAHYGEAIRGRPRHPGAFANRADAFIRKGEPEKGLADCDRALALDPAFANAMLNRGHALAALGRHDEACREFQRAVDAALEPQALNEAMVGLAASRTRSQMLP